MNDSTTGGFLLPLLPPPSPIEDDQLDNFLQAFVVGLTGLPPAMVRPRWQFPNQPVRPASTVNWCAIGITEETPEYGFTIIHHGSQKAFGWFDFQNVNPSPGDTVTVNGLQLTFENAIGGNTQVLIGSSLGMTLFNLLETIDAETDPRVTVMTYQVLGSRFMCTAIASGTVGNAYTLAASAALVSAPTLFGGDSDGFDEYQRHEEVTILATFYGPNSRAYAKTFRDGLAIPQNREVLQLNYMGLASTHCKVRHIPELYNHVWFHRSDIEFCLRVAIDRCYGVKNLLSAPVQLFTDIGLIQQDIAGPSEPVRPAF